MSTLFEDIKQRIDLVALIGQSVQLKRVGQSHRGLCPFHQEKTPSFYVRPEAHRWHCFGCGEHGDCFDWLMKHDSLSLKEALTTLAGMAGVKLDDQDRQHRISQLLERVQRYYVHCLHLHDNHRAMQYLLNRGLNRDTIDEFGIGYAPRDARVHLNLKEYAFTEDEIVASGIVIQDEGVTRDLLRDRIIFPIRSSSGHVIAFGGRVIGQQQITKYLNTRNSVLFQKQSVFYGLHEARLEIARKRQAVVVEGYMDVLAAHQHGFTNVVATLGTSITDSHLRQLSAIADDIVLAMDADKAGQSATWRSLQKAEETLRDGATSSVGPRRSAPVQGHASQVRVMRLPDGLDPDDLIRNDAAQWHDLLVEAKTVVDFAMDHVADRYNLNDSEQSAAAAAEIADTLVWVSNPVSRAHYIQKAADLLDVDESDVRELVNRRSYVQRGQRAEPVDSRDESEWDEYTLALLATTALPPAGICEFSKTASAHFAQWLQDRSCADEPPPEEFGDLGTRVAKWTTRVSELSNADRSRELLQARNVLHRQRLFSERAEVLSVLRATDDPTERATLAQRYSAVSGAIVAADAALAR